MKIAVVGSREFKDKDLIRDIMSINFNVHNNDTLISGGARGVDSISECIVDKWNKIAYAYSKTPKQIKKIIFKPDWDRYGKSAGFIRNKLIIDEADMVLAFWSNQSKGTKHSIDLAIKANKPINIYIR